MPQINNKYNKNHIIIKELVWLKLLNHWMYLQFVSNINNIIIIIKNKSVALYTINNFFFILLKQLIVGLSIYYDSI